MSVDSAAIFDASRVRAYAKKVARAQQGCPFSTVPVLVKSENRKLFKRTVILSQGFETLPGWVILINREEGLAASVKARGTAASARHDGFEYGQALLLDPEGKLLVSRYESFIGGGSNPGSSIENISGLNFVEASPSDIFWLDKLNRHTYRNKTAGPNQVWRAELGVRFAFRGKGDTPGIETSLALKAFLEDDSYFATLSNGFFNN